MTHDSISAVMKRIDPLLDEFDEIPRAAMTKYRGYPPDVLITHTKRTAANCIYDHMVAECERRFDGRDDIHFLELSGGLKLWLLGKETLHTVIRWKKMDEDGRSRNYPTKQAKTFDQQLPLKGLPPAPTRITVGYWPDAAGVSILRTQVARPNGRFVDWCAGIVPLAERVDGAEKWVDVTMQSRWAG